MRGKTNVLRHMEISTLLQTRDVPGMEISKGQKGFVWPIAATTETLYQTGLAFQHNACLSGRSA